MNKHISRLLALIIVIVLGIVIWRIVDFNARQTAPYNETQVVATTSYPLYDIVSHVAGDAVDVVQLIPTGADPHDFEPTPSMAEQLADIPVVYAVGLGYDDWIKQLTGFRTDVASLATDIDRHFVDGSVDPHIWLSIENVKYMTQLTARDLSSRFPDDKATFEVNRDAYLAELDAAAASIRADLEAMDEKSIVTMHDAWYYFANEYGLTVIDTFEEAGSDEPSARHIAELAETMHEAGIATIFADYGHDEPALTSFAKDNNFTLLTLDPEGAAANYDSLIDLLLANAETISKNQ